MKFEIEKHLIGHLQTNKTNKAIKLFDVIQSADSLKIIKKINDAAEKNNKKPKDFCDNISKIFKNLTKSLNLSNDDFIRTTEERHHKAVQFLWEKLQSKGYIYLSKYKGWYSVSDEAYYNEDEVIEKDGKKISTISGSVVEWVEEESFFFKLSSFQEKLLEFYNNNPKFILPNSRKNEVVSFVQRGLKDLSVSRKSFTWGIKVPNNKKHIIYVWLDALTNYLSALNYPNDKDDLFKNFWPATLHIIGKDILRFHAIYWPAFLLAADIKPPNRVYGHGWILSDKEKMSKSKGNILDPLEVIKIYGLDQLRYYLVKEVSFGNDGNISNENIENCINSDLANNYGNFCQRTFSFVEKNCKGVVPSDIDFNSEDLKILNSFSNNINKIRSFMDNQQLNEYVKFIVDKSFDANKYFNDEAPWNKKDDKLYAVNHGRDYLYNHAPKHFSEWENSVLPADEFMLIEEGEKVKPDTTLFQWDPYTDIILSRETGIVKLKDFIEGETYSVESVETGKKQIVVIEARDRKLSPHLEIVDEKGGIVSGSTILPVKATLVVNDKENVQRGQTLVKIPKDIGKTRDITGGLPRVAELFESRKPSNPAVMTEINGTVKFGDTRRGIRKIHVIGNDGDDRSYSIPYGKHVIVHEGDFINAGSSLCEGAISPDDILRVLGPSAVREYLVNEIQEVYRLQGVKLNDKHIEIIVNQMMQKVMVKEVGDSRFLQEDRVSKNDFLIENERLATMVVVTSPGDTGLEEEMMIEKTEFNDLNKEIKAEGKKIAKYRKVIPATFEPILMGITRASLNTDSFISAASFQETTRVLTDAATAGKTDYLYGLKENVAVGRLIPAGTGTPQFKDILVGIDDQDLSEINTDDAVA